MEPQHRLLFALILVCSVLALGFFAESRPWSSPSGPGQKAASSTTPVEDSPVENRISVGIILLGFGVLTIRMLHYRREMEQSVLQRLRREWKEGRALLESGRSFVKEAFESGAFSDRRAAPRNGEREARA